MNFGSWRPGYGKSLFCDEVENNARDLYIFIFLYIGVCTYIYLYRCYVSPCSFHFHFFIFLIGYFEEQNILILKKSNLSFFFFYSLCFLSCYLCLTYGQRIFFCIFFRPLIAVGFPFQCMINLRLIFK